MSWGGCDWELMVPRKHNKSNEKRGGVEGAGWAASLSPHTQTSIRACQAAVCPAVGPPLSLHRTPASYQLPCCSTMGGSFTSPTCMVRCAQPLGPEACFPDAPQPLRQLS